MLFQNESSPLTFASQKGFTKIVQMLLEAGANVDHQTEVCLRAEM